MRASALQAMEQQPLRRRVDGPPVNVLWALATKPIMRGGHQYEYELKQYVLCLRSWLPQLLA